MSFFVDATTICILFNSWVRAAKKDKKYSRSGRISFVPNVFFQKQRFLAEWMPLKKAWFGFVPNVFFQFRTKCPLFAYQMSFLSYQMSFFAYQMSFLVVPNVFFRRVYIIKRNNKEIYNKLSKKEEEKEPALPEREKLIFSFSFDQGMQTLKRFHSWRTDTLMKHHPWPRYPSLQERQSQLGAHIVAAAESGKI